MKIHLRILDIENSGIYTLAGLSKKQANNELACWVAEVWESEWGERKMPKSPSRAIKAYFEDPCEDSCVYDTLDIPDEQVAEYLAKHGWDVRQMSKKEQRNHWGSDRRYPRVMWEEEAGRGDTSLGYWQWVESQYEADGISQA